MAVPKKAPARAPKKPARTIGELFPRVEPGKKPRDWRKATRRFWEGAK